MPVIDPSAATGDVNTNGQRDVSNHELTKDDFMKIFLAQMKMQSPLKPYDSSAMLEQMSQLTSLTATEELNKTVQNLNQNMAKSQVIAATGLIGKSVVVPTDKSPLVKGATGESLKGSVILDQAVTSLTITIKDAKGNVVKTINKGPSSNGVVDFDWDGKDSAGNDMPEDFYTMEATGGVAGQQVKFQTCGAYKVGSVGLNPQTGAVFLNIDGYGGINMDEIIKILG